jgi:hypothetical protein
MFTLNVPGILDNTISVLNELLSIVYRVFFKGLPWCHSGVSRSYTGNENHIIIDLDDLCIVFGRLGHVGLVRFDNQLYQVHLNDTSLIIFRDRFTLLRLVLISHNS